MTTRASMLQALLLSAKGKCLQSFPYEMHLQLCDIHWACPHAPTQLENLTCAPHSSSIQLLWGPNRYKP